MTIGERVNKDWPVNQDICLSTFLFGLVHWPQRLHQSACQSHTPLFPHLWTRPQDTPPTEAGPHHKVVPGELRLLSVITLKMSGRRSATVRIMDSNWINIQSGQEFFSLYSSAQTLLFSNFHVCKEKQPVRCAPTFPVSPLVGAFDTKRFGKKSAMPADERSCSVTIPITDQSCSVNTPQASKLWTVLWPNDSKSHVVWTRYYLALKYLWRRHLPDL